MKNQKCPSHIKFISLSSYFIVRIEFHQQKCDFKVLLSKRREIVVLLEKIAWRYAPKPNAMHRSSAMNLGFLCCVILN